MKKEQLEKYLLETIGTYIQRHISLAGNNIFVSITNLKVSSSLEIVKIYLSLIGGEKIGKEAFLREKICDHFFQLKKYVATKLRHRLRRIPLEFYFYVDETPERATNLVKLIEAIEAPS